PSQIYRSGQDYLSPAASKLCRLPAGHTEGYLGAFANIYRSFAADLRRVLGGEAGSESSADYPGIEDGIRGLAFIEACVKSSQNNAAWTPLQG
ncbi:MAG: gfo/Idh/MocA family oxidoreductase, partial [Puniceicoccales bacterium]